MADRNTPPPDEQPDDSRAARSREAGSRADGWREGSWYEQAESETARAFEELVSRPSFGVLLARSAENVAALARIGSDVADLVLRNLRIAGRADVTRLARQLHRTEDKLERLLQEVEALRDEPPPSPSVRGPRARSATRSRGNGANASTRTRTPS